MFLYQEVRKDYVYNMAYELGKWTAQNKVLAFILLILLLSLLVFIISKMIKSLRSN